jgi:hypothetical protein
MLFPFETFPIDPASFWYGFQCGAFAMLCIVFLIYTITRRSP